MSLIADKNQDDYYNYIAIGKELWYENPNAKTKNGDICPKVSPYAKSFITAKDIQKRIVKFKDEFSCEFNKTLPILNDMTLNVCDMANTKDINEVDLLLNLKNRYLSNNNGNPDIFTNVGPTLLIVNPFKRLTGVYDLHVIDYFIHLHETIAPEQRKELKESHLYDTVLIAIRELLKENSLNQVLIISGESGAGKTETTKDAMRCITYYFSTKNNRIKSSISYKDNLGNQILNCNPILEAFGNARTIRNDNSSRFGKYVKLKFNASTFAIEGAKIKTYLLEKSRISELSISERNYHIFYMFLKGGKDSELKSYHLLRNINTYSYLYKGPQQIMEIDKINDINLYKDLIACFKSTGFTSEEISTVFKVLAIVLHLGNLKIIKRNDEETEVITNEDFEYVVSLLEVDYDSLLNNLTRKPPSKHMKEWGSVYEDKIIKQFIDSLAKDLYQKLFQWVVAKLNTQLNKKTNAKQRYIGLLDIFGFECLNKNSLEQFCINYTNEKLQQLYIKDIFESDKDELKKEGLEDKISLLDATFKDNKDIIKCMEAFFYLTKSDATDERVYTTASNYSKEIEKDDKSRLDKLRDIKHNCIFTDRINKEQFKLCHSARDVIYTTKNWAEKNIDEIKDSMMDCLLLSKSTIIQMICTSTTNMISHENEKKAILAEREESSVTKEFKKYLGLKFQIDMDDLKKSLEKCSHHYIRCIKPNEDKAPLEFWDNFVFNQIQYLGILGTIQVRKSGFPVRRKYKDFYEAFQLVHRRKKEIAAICDYMETTSQIINDLIGKAYNYEDKCLFGRTKVYMKQLFNIQLEKAKEEKLKKKYEALSILKTGYVKKLKSHRLKAMQQSIKKFQEMYRTKVNTIRLCNKIKAIELIQSAFNAKKAYEYYDMSMINVITIQNSFRIVKARREILHRNYLNNIINVRLLIYLKYLKENTKEKISNLTNNILHIVKQKIIDREYNAIWDKVNPFMIATLVRRKYKHIVIQTKLKARVFMKEYTFSVFSYRSLMKKIAERKTKAKIIFNFGSTSMISNYYYNMIQKVTIVQRYIQRHILRKEAIKKTFDLLIQEEENARILMHNKNHQILFHNKTHLCLSNNKKDGLYTETNLVTQDNNNTQENNHRSNTCRKISPYKNNIVVTYTESLSRRFINKSKCKYVNREVIEEKKDVPLINEYHENKINIFAKIAAIDIISSEEHCYEESWAKEYEKVFCINMTNNTPIQLIYAGNCHSFAINSKGKAFSWGWNDKGQCGVDYTKSYRQFITSDLTSGSDGVIQSLAVQSYVKSGMQIRSKDLGEIGKVVIGDDYTMTLNKEGNVFLFGDNSKCQLGESNICIMNAFHMLPNEMRKKGIVDIYSTENLNGVLTRSNELFIWFISALNNSSEFKLNQIFIDRKIVIQQISCGKSFMMVLSKSGRVYGCGSNTSGELSIPKDNLYRFHTLNEIVPLTKHHDRILQVRCGFKHVVCLSSTGYAYTWGNNSYGQLGNGTKSSSSSIVKIALKHNKGKEEKERIIQVAAGFRASMFMSDKRELYYCGIIDACNVSFIPIKFNIKEKLEELGNQNEYAPVRILTSWNRSFSLFYISIADIRQVISNVTSNTKVSSIINILAEKWLDENIYPPYYPQLAHYFYPSIMKKKKEQ